MSYLPHPLILSWDSLTYDVKGKYLGCFLSAAQMHMKRLSVLEIASRILSGTLFRFIVNKLENRFKIFEDFFRWTRPTTQPCCRKARRRTQPCEKKTVKMGLFSSLLTIFLRTGSTSGTDYFVSKYSIMARAACLPAPMAKMTVAAPVTASPPAYTPSRDVNPVSSSTTKQPLLSV